MTAAPPEAETPPDPKKRTPAKKTPSTPAPEVPTPSYDDDQALRLQALKDADGLLNDGETRPLVGELLVLADWILGRDTTQADHEPVDDGTPALTFTGAPSATATPEGNQQ